MIVLLAFESFNGSRDSTTSLYTLVPLKFIGSISHESQLERKNIFENLPTSKKDTF